MSLFAGQLALVASRYARSVSVRAIGRARLKVVPRARRKSRAIAREFLPSKTPCTNAYFSRLRADSRNAFEEKMKWPICLCHAQHGLNRRVVYAIPADS